jgi:hypothetical protein
MNETELEFEVEIKVDTPVWAKKTTTVSSIVGALEKTTTVGNLMDALATLPADAIVAGTWEGVYRGVHRVTYVEDARFTGGSVVVLDVDTYTL